MAEEKKTARRKPAAREAQPPAYVECMVAIPYFDRVTGDFHAAGETVEVTEERFDEIASKGAYLIRK